MIRFENTEVSGWEAALRGMRNPKNSWDRSDSIFILDGFAIGDNDYKLAKTLADAGQCHGKYMRMINVTVDIIAPMYWWQEFDTYKVGTVRNSCSKMHKIHAKEFTLDDFSHEHLEAKETILNIIIRALNHSRILYLNSKDKRFWWQMIQLLPASYNQRSTVQMNYAVLKNIYEYRRDHKLDEWKEFCRWIESLPYSELITGRSDHENVG